MTPTGVRHRDVFFRHAWSRVAWLAGVLLAAGCEEPTTGTVTGVITVDGAPAKNGSIAFFPMDGKASTAGAGIVDGNYTAQVAFGQSKVEIRVPKVIGERKLYDAPNSPTKSIMAESLPARFNDETELTLDVKPGETQGDFDLKTK
jgi:hypothetical protein